MISSIQLASFLSKRAMYKPLKGYLRKKPDSTRNFGLFHTSKSLKTKDILANFDLLRGIELVELTFDQFFDILLISTNWNSRRRKQVKKYASRATKYLAILSLICIVILTSGIVLSVVGSPNTSLGIGLTIFGGMFSYLFLVCYFAERSRTLRIDSNTVIFPRGANVNGKMVLKKTVVKIDEISFVESKLYEGDGLFSSDCYFHTLTLKDGAKITVTLYSYGKAAEKEILEFIKNSIM